MHLKSDEWWMSKALALAHRAEQEGEVPVGAVIVLNDQLIAEGWNQPISTHDPTAHAEVVTLRRSGEHLNNYRLIGTTLYVTLEPCVMCVGAMIHARIGRLVFGAYDPRAGAVQSVFQIPAEKKLNHQIEWQGGVLQNECGELLVNFFKKRR